VLLKGELADAYGLVAKVGRRLWVQRAAAGLGGWVQAARPGLGLGQALRLAGLGCRWEAGACACL
jgi:hypothetical protein